jgi:hypothetical protein
MVVTTRGTLMIAYDFAFTSIDGVPLPLAAWPSRLESLPPLGPPQMFAGFVRERCGRKWDRRFCVGWQVSSYLTNTAGLDIGQAAVDYGKIDPREAEKALEDLEQTLSE